MPYKPNKQCPGRGLALRKCGNIIKADDKYCPSCAEYAQASSKLYDQYRDKSAERKFIHSVRWQSIRLAKLAKDPLCEICLEAGRDTAAVLVHHIDGDELNNCNSNHQSACNNCHEGLHKSGRWGKVRKGKGE